MRELSNPHPAMVHRGKGHSKVSPRPQPQHCHHCALGTLMLLIETEMATSLSSTYETGDSRLDLPLGLGLQLGLEF